jgi:hypothetical protein
MLNNDHLSRRSSSFGRIKSEGLRKFVGDFITAAMEYGFLSKSCQKGLS